jgi:SP family arabinose:H+ symporter-like MFS transporter
MSIATTALWTVGYLGNQLFPLMMKHFSASGTFWTFSAGAMLTFVLVYLLVPETRGQTLEQITLFWTSRPASPDGSTTGRVETPLPR